MGSHTHCLLTPALATMRCMESSTMPHEACMPLTRHYTPRIRCPRISAHIHVTPEMFTGVTN